MRKLNAPLVRRTSFFRCECGKLHTVSPLIMSSTKCKCSAPLLPQMMKLNVNNNVIYSA